MNITSRTNPDFSIRKYQDSDLEAVRAIYGDDEFARPQLVKKYPRMKEFLADEILQYYTRFEPESLLVAEVNGEVVGALLGAVNSTHQEQICQRYVKPYLVRRCLTGAYGWPIWLLSVLRTELAGRKTKIPPINLNQYPAHLHIGILPTWRRKGIGTGLMNSYSAYLRKRNVAGYHLYASSFHPLGVAFYRKLGLDDLGRFIWRFHNGFAWLNVTEYIFGRRLK